MDARERKPWAYLAMAILLAGLGCGKGSGGAADDDSNDGSDSPGGDGTVASACAPAARPQAPLPALHTSGRYLVDPRGHHVILRGVVTISMGHIHGPKGGPPWFGLTIPQYIDSFSNWSESEQTGWAPTVVRMMFNSWPSSSTANENDRDPQHLAYYPPPFSYDPATLPASCQPGTAYAVGDTCFNNTLVWRAVQAGTSAGGPERVNANFDGTTTDGSVKWTVVNPTVLTDADWADWCEAVLFPSVDYALSKNLYVIITLNDFGDPADNPTLFQRHQSFFGRLSSAADIAGQKYRNDPGVLFENHGEIIRHGAGVWAEIKPYFQQTLDLVRANGAENVFITSTPGWCGSTRDATDDPLIGDDVAYANHTYDFNTQDLSYLDHQLSSDQPVILTEFGNGAASWIFWMTYHVGDVVWTDGTWYEAIKSQEHGSVPDWVAGTYSVGDQVWSDQAVWTRTVAGASTAPPSGQSAAGWALASSRNYPPADNLAWWRPTTSRPAWFAQFLATIEPTHGATHPPVGLTAWSVTSDWIPALFTSNALTTPTGWGEEAREWLQETRNCDLAGQ